VAEKRPFRIVLGEGPQKGVLGGSLSRYVPPGAQYDYKPPSVFARYRVVSVIFVLLAIALLAFWVTARLHVRRSAKLPTVPVSPAPPATQPDPVYVTPLPNPPRNQSEPNLRH
jgi:hypothetical protein